MSYAHEVELFPFKFKHEWEMYDVRTSIIINKSTWWLQYLSLSLLKTGDAFQIVLRLSFLKLRSEKDLNYKNRDDYNIASLTCQ